MRFPLKMAFESIANLFRKPVTSKFPAVPREYFPRSRGHIGIEVSQCVFCGLCQRKCPTDAIVVNRAESAWTIDRLACIACGGCVECCPKKCLRMENSAFPPVSAAEKDKMRETFRHA